MSSTFSIGPFSNPEPFEPQNLTGGLVDTPHIGAVPPNAASELLNVEFRNQGLMRRHGRVLVGQQCSAHPLNQGTLAYRPNTSAAQDLSLYLNAQAAVSGSSTYLYSINASVSIGAASGVLPAGAADIIGSNAQNERVGGFVQMNNYAFYWDGGTVRKKFIDLVTPHGDGDITDWGYQGADLTAWTNGTINAGGSKTDGKAYYGVWTLFNSTTGEETNPSAASAVWNVSAPNQQRDITIPVTPGWTADWDKIRVYSTFGDGQGVYYFEREVTVTEVLTATTQTITNGWSLSDSELGSEIEFDNHPPGQVLYLTVFDNRIFAVDALDPSSVIYSKDENPHAFPPVNKIYVEKDAGDLIGGLFVLGDGRLYAVNKLDGVYMLTPGVSGTYTVEKVASGWGCVDHNSIVVVAGFAYWVDQKGIVRFDGHNVTNISDPQIRQTFKRFKPYLFDDQSNPGGVGNSTGCPGWHDKEADRLYLRWLVRDASEGVTYQLIFDLTHEAWLLHRPGPELVQAGVGHTDRCIGKVVRSATHEQYLVTGDSEGWHYQLNTEFKKNALVWSDNDTPFLWHWRSPWYGTGREDFLPLWIDFEYERATQGMITANIIVETFRDGIETADQTENFPLHDTGPLRVRQRMNLKAKTCERFAVKFRCDGKDADVRIMNFRLYGAQEGIKVLGV